MPGVVGRLSRLHKGQVPGLTRRYARVRMPRTSSVAPPPSSEFRADNPPFLDRSNFGGY